MSTATIERPSESTAATSSVADLRTAYAEAAGVVAGFDLDDILLWRRVDGIVAGLTATAYALTAAITGRATGATATRVPPVVRVRELAVVHGHLSGALDRHPAPPAELVEPTLRRVRRYGELLRFTVDQGEVARAYRT
jgi:hypothetical protein